MSDTITIDADRYREMTALQGRVDTLIATARDAKHERDAATRALSDARTRHAAELATVRAELAREREASNPTTAREREELRAEISRLRGVVARQTAMLVHAGQLVASIDALRAGVRPDGDVR